MLNEKKIFICLTPLQMKISERIISENSIVDYKIICLFLISNEKYTYYYERIKENSIDSFVYYPKEKATGFSLLKDVYVFKKMILKSGILEDVSSIYAASIDNRYVQLIVSMLRNVKIYTFDDGLANLNYNGSYYRNESLSKFRYFLWGMIGVNFFAQDFRNKSDLHYTLYKDKKNISPSIEYVRLLENNNDQRPKAQDVINVFLGQPLNEVNKSADNKFINDILKKFSIDMYFPHPREKYIINNDIEVKCSDLIFEDYILGIYKKNINLKRVNIYTFFSTAVLNLDNVDFINCYVILNADYFDKEIYQVFDGFNVELLIVNS